MTESNLDAEWIGRRLLRRPDEIYLLVIGTVGLLPTLLGAPTESVSEIIVWPPLRFVWAATFVGLSVLIIALSIRPRDLISTAIRLRGAHRVLAASTSVYALVVLGSGINDQGWADGLRNGVIVAAFTLGYAGVRLIRARELSRWLETQKRRAR